MNLRLLARREKGAALDPEEIRLFDAVASGRRAELDGGTLEARWLAWLLTTRTAIAEVTARGLHVCGTPAAPLRITGNLDAAYARVPFPVVFEHCRFEGRLELTLADLPLLTFDGCATEAVELRGASIGMLRFRLGTECVGGLTLTAARVERAVDFTGARLVAPAQGHALIGDWMRVNGPLNFHSLSHDASRFEAVGPMRLYGARIGGDVNLRRAMLRNAAGTALNADQIVVEGTLLVSRSEVSGQFSMVGATISGDVVAEDAQVDHGQPVPASDKRYAMVADHARIGGSVYLRKGFRAKGQVRFYGASIDRDVECHGGRFENGGATALNLQNARIAGNLQFGDADTPLRCHVDGMVDLQRAAVGGALLWRCLDRGPTFKLDLSSTRAATLADEAASWPKASDLELHNFEYDAIADGSPVEARERLGWLRLSHTFSHQAYDQLATVLRRTGRFADAREVLYGKEYRHATETPLTLGDRWWYGYGIGPARVGFGPLAGYGYRLNWAFIVMLATVIVCGLLFGLGHPGLMSPRSAQPPSFQSLAYSLDVFVPILDLGQAGGWIPNPEAGRHLASGPTGDLRTGGVLLALYWLEIAMGWSVSSVLVGTITARLVRD